MSKQRDKGLLVAAEGGSYARRQMVALRKSPYQGRVGNYGKKLSAAWHNAWAAENKLMNGN